VGNKDEAYDEQDIIQIQLVANELQKIIRQRRADETLRENERLLADAQQIGHLGSWENNLTTGQLQWSDETYRIFQIPVGTPISFSDYLKCIHPDDLDMIQKTHRNILAGIAPPDIEHRIIWPNGEVRYIFRRGQMEFDSSGKLVKLKGSVQDITEQKRVDMELQSFNQELERRVTERTAQLETANRELESFAYTISHDLRAPLRHIHGFVELLSEESSFLMNETTREYMKIISASTKQMGTLIDDLLTFTHLGRKEMVKIRVDMNELVHEAVRELAPETAGRSILWQIDNLPDVNGDRAMLQLAMVNLISNAIKFTRPRPEAKIEVGCYQEVPTGMQVFFVRDNGVGFDMQYAGKLFGVFQRLLRTTEFEGNGIGLANARRIIQRHDGKIWAEAQVDQGATFFFTLRSA
jgi:signal transduction histidine kinase